MTTATQSQSAADLRADAARMREEAAASFERCDTDGFMSQWANGVMAGLRDLEARLADEGGMWTFPALFDLDGNLVPAKRVETRYGMAWGLLNPDDPDGSFLGWFNPSQARDPQRERAANARKGFYVGLVKAPAGARLHGASKVSVSATVYRKDGGYSADAEIVDNGQ